MSDSDPHSGASILAAGAEVRAAKAAMIMVHGRGADAADILSLSQVIDRPDVAYLAPEAAGHTWYPRPFTVPVEQNEPYYTSAIRTLARLFARLARDGLSPDKVVLLGFSQGACLSLTFAARNPTRYGGVIALSGALIGETIDAGDYSGSLAGTPVFLGCSDVDPHIPLVRVRQSTEIMRGLGGEVTERIYPGFGHSINEDEVTNIRAVLDRLAAG